MQKHGGRNMRKAIIFAALVIGAITATADTFSGTLYTKTTWTHTKTIGNSSLNETLPDVFLWTHANGTNALQMNALVSKTTTLAAGATNTINLAAAVDGFGDSINFSTVRFIAVTASNGNDNAVYLGGAASDPFSALFGSASESVAIKPGGIAMFSAPYTTGYTVGTSTNLQVRNSGTNSATYFIYIGGVKQ
jgi:hypothetical protein